MNLVKTLSWIVVIIATPIFAQEGRDAIFIMGITPQTLVDGVSSKVRIKIAYECTGTEKAALLVRDNSLNANDPLTVQTEKLEIGSGTREVDVLVTPRIWTDSSLYELSVAIRRISDDGVKIRLSATDYVKPKVEKARGEKLDAIKGQRSSETYVDEVSIVSFSPGMFEVNKPQRVVARVKYTLMTHNSGAICFGCGAGRGNGYKILTDKKVEMGSGYVDFDLEITPQKTGSLLLDRVYVNLSEYLHPDKWSTLADDSAVIELSESQ